MADLARLKRGDEGYALARAKPYAETYFGQMVDHSDVFDDVRVRMRTPPVPLDTAGEYDNPDVSITARLLGFNGRLQSDYEPSPHGNLLIDTPAQSPILGQAFADPADSMAGKMTDAGVLNYGAYLHELEPNHTPPNPGK